ncbi:hypothetical protein P3L10_016658 [Capsicum annuum]
MLAWKKSLVFYAVKLGLAGVVSDMLAWKKSLVYLPAGSEYDWMTAIHIAASEATAATTTFLSICLLPLVTMCVN